MVWYIMMKKITIDSNSSFDELRCTVCLLPMQYQTKKDGKFLWQCFKCGKQYFVSQNIHESIEESWSPPR
jgi:hypothetical protein